MVRELQRVVESWKHERDTSVERRALEIRVATDSPTKSKEAVQILDRSIIRALWLWVAIPIVVSLAGTPSASVRADEVGVGLQVAGVRRTMEVYQRGGCGDLVLAQKTADWASRRGLPVEVVAAQVVVESTCNPAAVSRDGSVGLMQVRVKTWRREFRLKDDDMLDADKSLEVGTEILRRLVAKHGLPKGVERYNGRGERARWYARKVFELTGRRTQ